VTNPFSFNEQLLIADKLAKDGTCFVTSDKLATTDLSTLQSWARTLFNATVTVFAEGIFKLALPTPVL
jgi:hypothetical protein